MFQVKYDMPDAQTSLEFLLEQVISGAEVVIVRYGIEVARITATPAAAPNTGHPTSPSAASLQPLR